MPPSRQERRKAERDAAKRAPGASRAAGAAAALIANPNVKPLGDWRMQAEDPSVGPGPSVIARQVIGCLSTRETRVQSLVNNSMTCRAISAWPDPSALFEAIGGERVKRRATEGDREAQYSHGCRLMSEVVFADGAGLSGAAGRYSRSPKLEVGLAHRCTFRSPTRPSCVDGHLSTKIMIYYIFAGANHGRRRAWRSWRRRRGKGTCTL